MRDRSHPDLDALAERRERFMRLLMPLYKRLEDFAFAMARDVDEACDLVAETLLRAFESYDRLNDEKAFLSYLFTIASREFRRRRRRERWFGSFNEEAAERIVCGGMSPDMSADVELLYKALAELPHKEREAIVLFEISGFSLKEIQQIQGGSLSSIKVRLLRGRKRLAGRLGVEEPSGRMPAMRGRRSDSDGDASDSFLISFESNVSD